VEETILLNAQTAGEREERPLRVLFPAGLYHKSFGKAITVDGLTAYAAILVNNMPLFKISLCSLPDTVT